MHTKIKVLINRFSLLLQFLSETLAFLDSVLLSNLVLLQLVCHPHIDYVVKKLGSSSFIRDVNRNHTPQELNILVFYYLLD